MLSETAHVEFETLCAQFGTARLEFGTACAEFGSAWLELGKPTQPTKGVCKIFCGSVNNFAVSQLDFNSLTPRSCSLIIGIYYELSV